MNEKDKLPKVRARGVRSAEMAAPTPPATSAREAWRVFGIMAEFVEATERLAAVRPAVSIFGSARVTPDSTYYQQTETIARLLGLNLGFYLVARRGLPVDETTTVRAKAFLAGWDASATVSLSVTVTPGAVRTPTFSIAGGRYPAARRVFVAGAGQSKLNGQRVTASTNARQIGCGAPGDEATMSRIGRTG